MCAVAPLTISGWQTIIATVVVILLTLGYGELRARDTPQRPQGRHHNPPPREPANPQPPRRPSATTAEDNPV